MPLADDILAVLNDPTHMWSHALKELPQDSQRLFLTLPLMPQQISVDDLQIAYSTQKFTRTETFLDSLRALEDSFISIEAGYRSLRFVDFRNPSLQDFSYEYLNRYSDWLDTLLSAPAYYEQVSGAFKLAISRHPEHYRLSSKGPVKYPGIQAWVTSRYDDLFAKQGFVKVVGHV